MSHLVDALIFQIRAAGLPSPALEHRFHHTRRWRFDLAWPDIGLACEVEGGVWTGGRHTRGKGFIGDCDKYNTAQIEGWRVLRVTGQHIKSGSALTAIEDALRAARRVTASAG